MDLAAGPNLRRSIRKTRPTVSVTNSLVRVTLVIALEFLFQMCFFFPTQLLQFRTKQGIPHLLRKSLRLQFPFANEIDEVCNLSQCRRWQPFQAFDNELLI